MQPRNKKKKKKQNLISHEKLDATDACCAAQLTGDWEVHHTLAHRTQTLLRRDKEHHIKILTKEDEGHFLINDLRSDPFCNRVMPDHGVYARSCWQCPASNYTWERRKTLTYNQRLPSQAILAQRLALSWTILSTGLAFHLALCSAAKCTISTERAVAWYLYSSCDTQAGEVACRVNSAYGVYEHR